MSVYNPITSDYPSRVFSEVGEKLYLKADMADVHFVFNSDDESIERIPAHKLILMAASDVFRTMFNGTWKEQKEVKIVDVSADAFKEFLQFFYLNRVKLTMENVDKVMNLGKMYDMAECVAVCSKFLKNNLNDDNVCSSYGLAILFDQKDLKRSCESVIGLNTIAVLKSPGFFACNEKAMAEILKLNWLQCTEIELFEACMSWLKAICKQDVLTKEIVQAKLGESFYEFRFGLMVLQDIHAMISNYFSHSEYAEIFQMITYNGLSPDQLDVNQAKRLKQMKRDSFPWDEKDLIQFGRLFSRYRSTEPYFIKNLEITKFSSNGPLLLKQFELCTVSKYLNGKFQDTFKNVPTEMTIVEVTGAENSKNETLLYNEKENLTSPNSDPHRIVCLSKPIFIRPGFVYEIRLKQDPPKDCAISPLMMSERRKEGITIQFHDDPLIPNDFSRTGLVYKLMVYPIGI
ncbi:BTB/POZ domain-containing protein 3-like [Sitodiplosis mosellana]|uniref:BTB/POZ domain-containing protein 3-like n=1 Tax=Sitodiplosis mosellana TaxID=263140 RepID=UPI00244452F7|nr:BTB/POZ domain-containing protein 3-like [Sitodiplosis mosellana]